jgi:hypothetical protein
MKTYLTLVRSVQNSETNSVIGHLYINGKFFCTTLENLQKRIPKGLYSLSLTYSPKFKRNLPLISAVPYRSGIRIHSGNRSSDSQGCVLVGLRDDYYTLKDSRITLSNFITALFDGDSKKNVYQFEVK